MEWLFLDSPKQSALKNMQIDKELFLGCKKPVFRIYSWDEDSFTIGRFQKLEDIDNPRQYGSNWAQRITGGGLLLHGKDVSYTIVIPASMLGKRGVKKSYEYLCRFLMDFYKKLGLSPAWAKDVMPDSLWHSDFCQEGFEPYDIIIEGKKIGGNAQKRSKDTILQHGSIPLKKEYRPHSGYSLEELGVDIGEKEAKELLKTCFQETYNVSLKDKDEI